MLESNNSYEITNNNQFYAPFKGVDNRIVCYEIRTSFASNESGSAPTNSQNNGGSNGTSGAHQYGVSSTNAFSDDTTTLNRYFPANGGHGGTTAQQLIDGYAKNRENSSGYRIEVPGITSSAGTQLSLSASYDWFVMLWPDDPLKHHFAKITEVTTSDVLGDSFEFSPGYGADIPKGTPFNIWRGPSVNDTQVVALSYGLAGSMTKYVADTDNTDGAGYAEDSRHSGFTYCAKPLFYFYNDRLDKPNQLNHNTKYMLHCSKTDSKASNLHFQRAFTTGEDYGKRAIDYSRYNTLVTVVDNLKTYDDINASAASTEHYDGTQISYSANVSDWNSCFRNTQRSDADLIYSAADNTLSGGTDDFIGPNRYLYYTASPDKVSGVAEVIDLEVFESITKTGTYMSLTIADPKRIYNKKIQQNDTIYINKSIGSGFTSENYTAQIFGTVTGTTSSTTLTFSGLEDGQDLRLLLQNSINFDTIRINNYIYRVTAIAAPSSSAATQTITIDAYKVITASSWTTSVSGAAETLTAQNCYRRAWSYITKTLMVDFNIDTIADYSNTAITNPVTSLIDFKVGTSTIDHTDTKLYKTHIVLLDGPYNGLRFKVSHGDQKNSIVRLENYRETLYLDGVTATNNTNGELLSYYTGSYYLEKTVFSGYTEVIEDYIEEGQYKIKIQGRDEVSKLLGPIVNKNYNYSEDIIYSTRGPYVHKQRSASTVYAQTSAANVGDPTLATTSGSLVAVGDLVFDNAVTNLNDQGVFIGEVSAVSGSAGSQTITLLDGVLSTFSGGNITYIRSTPIFSFSKALEHANNLTQAPTSLNSTAAKGLFFTSGNTITDGVEISPLVGTSQNSHEDAIGYGINYPMGISIETLDKTEGDSEFMCTLGSDFDVPAAISNFVVNSVDSNKGKGIINLAPISPVVLGRIDKDINYTTGETLVDANCVFITSSVNHNAIHEFNADSIADYKNIKIDDALYLSDGTLVGVVQNKHRRTDAANVRYYVTLDRAPSDNGITSLSRQKIYKINNRKNHLLSLLNIQGINNGEILHAINSRTSVAGNTMTSNHQFRQDYNNANTWNTNCHVLKHGWPMYRVYDIHKNSPGAMYINKRTYHPKDMFGQNPNIYSEQTGKLQGFGRALKTHPFLDENLDSTIDVEYDFGTLGSPEIGKREIKNRFQKELSLEATNNLPLLGSNYGDSSKYNNCVVTQIRVNGALAAGATNVITCDAGSSGTLDDPAHVFNEGHEVYNDDGEFLGICRTSGATSVTLYDTVNDVEHGVADNSYLYINYYNATSQSFWHRYPKYFDGNASSALTTHFDWALLPLSLSKITSSGDISGQGWWLNSIYRARDWLDIMDPKMAKYHLFAKGDLYPDCAKRKNSLFYGTKDITNYNLFLKSKGINEVATVPDGFAGKSNRQLLKDDSYEIATISNANENVNNLSRYNLMRLIEVTFDSQFNLIDPENPPSKKTGIEPFKYTTFQPIAQVDGSSTNPYITAHDSTTVVSVTGDLNELANGDYIFTNDGILLGRIHTSAGLNTPSAGKITFESAINYGTHGLLYHGPLYAIDDRHKLANVKTGFMKFDLIGRAGEDTLSAASNSTQKNYPVSLTQGAIFSGHADSVDAPRNEDENFNSDQLGSEQVMLPLVSVVYFNSDMDITFASSGTGGTTIVTVGGSSATDAETYFKVGDGVYDGTTYIGTVASTSGSNITINDSIAATPTGGNNVYKSESLLGNSIGKHPSLVLDSLSESLRIPATEHCFGYQRIVILERHAILEEGGATAPETITVSKGAVAMLDDNEISNKADCLATNPSPTPILHSKTFLNNYSNNGFAHYDATGAAFETDTYKGDGAYYVIKPQLRLKQLSLASDPLRNFESVHNTVGSTTQSDRDELQIITINNTAAVTGGGGAHDDNIWLDFAPNLTGYYLVSGSGLYTGSYDGTSLSKTDANQKSSANVRPGHIAKIISHVKRRDLTHSHGITHQITIDNPIPITTSGPSGNVIDHQYFRVMKPAEICLHQSTPDTIKLYELTSEFTKQAYSNNMYTNIYSYPTVNVITNTNDDGDILSRTFEHIKQNKNSTRGSIDYDEGVLSMYVMIDPDNKSNSNFLIPRTPAELFGLESETLPLKNGSYNFTFTDGNKAITTEITMSACKSTTIVNPKIEMTFAKNMPEMIGAVSMGTPFTITTPKPIDNSDIESAKIGATVTICQEVEDIIEDIMESNHITYTDSSIEYPIYSAPNFQGIDVFSAANYLSKLKNKRLLIDIDTIKLEVNDDNLRFQPIEISDKTSDNIDIIAIKRESAAFDFYNHITVYGRGVKSTARNPVSIKKVGKKSYEEFDNSLTTTIEVNKRARALLATHSTNEKTIVLETTTKGLEHLQAGDIIFLDLPRENIDAGHYKVLHIYHSIHGQLQISLGGYSKTMDIRLAELLTESKKVASFLRGDRFKGNIITNELLDTIKINPLKLRIRKTTTSSTGTFIGFTTPMNLGTYTLGFTGLGQTTTTLLEKDL